MNVVPSIPSSIDAAITNCAIPLAFYAQHLGMAECAFWGVNSDTDTGTCKAIWTLDNRRMVAQYLCMAQEMIENVLGYPLQQKWFTGEHHNLSKSTTYQTTWKRVIAGGVRATVAIALSESVDDTGDPFIVGPIATTVTDPNEIAIYHAGSDQEITPSAIEITGGNLTIEIPKCRMVLPIYYNNPPEGWPVGGAYFADEVDVIRVYNDPATQAQFIKANCAQGCGSTCVEETSPGCIRPIDYPLGIVRVLPGTYSGGAWTASGSLCGCYSGVRLNYSAGLISLTNDLVDAIIRLAHSLMPHAPCGCDPIKAFWERDRNIPQFMTQSREVCLFGNSDGAWAAWNIISNPGLRIMRAGVI